jgi:hypothetical protein
MDREDAALAALSTQMMPGNPAGVQHHYSDDDDDDQERLGSDTSRRDSTAASITGSHYTSATGESVYMDAQSNYTAHASQATIQRVDSIHSSLGERNQEHTETISSTTHQAATSLDNAPNAGNIGRLPVLPVNTAPDQQIDAAAAPSPRAEQEPPVPEAQQQGTMVSTATTVRPTVLPPATTRSSSNDETTAASSEKAPALNEGKKSKRKKGKNGSGSSTPKDETVVEDPELTHLTERQREIILEQV